MKQAGALALRTDAATGLLTGSTIGAITDNWTYNGFGEPTDYTATTGATTLLDVEYEHDARGRIVRMAETLAGVTMTYTYTYDLVGQLTEVPRNGLVLTTYSYDANGNRLNATTSGSIVTGTYDSQDRLLTYGTANYTYTPDGDRATKTVSGQTTTYSYDQSGNLRTVVLPDATQIAYVIDGHDRRIGKKVNGALVQGFLYQDDLRLVAELNSTGAVVSQFIYASRPNVPDYMRKGGQTYRILTDQLGSVRLVVNTATGQVVQRLDYDAFGKVTQDTNPGFQPFGFAGGLYDQHTKLTRFGARAYDAETGRWTAKDPIGFEGQDTNLYRYVGNDPVNFIDLTGEWWWWVVGGAVVGGGIDLAVQLFQNNGKWCAVNLMQAGLAALGGGAGVLMGAKISAFQLSLRSTVALNGIGSAGIGAITAAFQNGSLDPRGLRGPALLNGVFGMGGTYLGEKGGHIIPRVVTSLKNWRYNRASSKVFPNPSPMAYVFRGDAFRQPPSSMVGSDNFFHWTRQCIWYNTIKYEPIHKSLYVFWSNRSK